MDHQITGILFQCLTNPQYVAVAENRENALDKLALHAVDFDVLVIEKLHQGLSHGQSCSGHAHTLLLEVNGNDLLERCLPAKRSVQPAKIPNQNQCLRGQALPQQISLMTCANDPCSHPAPA